jgi:hypothetical protein
MAGFCGSETGLYSAKAGGIFVEARNHQRRFAPDETNWIAASMRSSQ